ncbi:MAG TPA: hypothetical protein VGG74_27440 [Kofleriaceae bacterium]|jgi:hypothetical protein
MKRRVSLPPWALVPLIAVVAAQPAYTLLSRRTAVDDGITAETLSK